MNVRIGLACLGLLMSCRCSTTSSVSPVSHGARPPRQSRVAATLNEYLTPPDPPNVHSHRGPGASGSPRHRHRPGHAPRSSSPGFGSSSASSGLRHGKILNPPASEAPGYFARLMGWLNPFGGAASASQGLLDDGSRGTTKEVNSGFLTPPPPPPPPRPNRYGPPAAAAAAHGPSTNSYERYALGEESLPRPPAPRGAGGENAYLPPQRAKNCDPCDRVPWVPLYHGMNAAVDSRYAAASAESSIDQGGGGPGLTNIHRAPSVSQEIKRPDFGYGPPSALAPILDPPNNRAQSPGASAVASSDGDGDDDDDDDDANLYSPQTEYGSPAFTGPIPNPHLYPGAMPPLFKAKPFDSQPRSTVTSSFATSTVYNFINPYASSFGGGAALGQIQIQSQRHDPSSDQGGSITGIRAEDHQFDQRELGNGGGSSFDAPPLPPVDHHRSGESSHSGASLDAGYVDRLPPGAETESSRGDDNFASSEETRQTRFEAIDTNFSSEKSNGQDVVVHYAQSPVIDLSLVEAANERGKDSSAASSSISTGAVEDPPVILLQNADGSYGINATWLGAGDGSKILWPDDDGLDESVAPAPVGSRSGSGQSARFGDAHRLSPSSLRISNGSSDGDDRENGAQFAIGYTDDGWLLANNSRPPEDGGKVDFGESTKDSRLIPSNAVHPGNESDRPDVTAGPSADPDASPQRAFGPPPPHPRPTSFDNQGNYGFKSADPSTDSTSESPFIEAPTKSYGAFDKVSAENASRGELNSGSTDARSFDSRQIRPGSGFQPSSHRNQSQRERNPGNIADALLRPANRQQGAKRNKQVQIIIPYTSQYTPKPFHSLHEDWSTKTYPGRTQARKVAIYRTNRDYLAEETGRLVEEEHVSPFFRSLVNSSRTKEATKNFTGIKTNTSIDVLRLQKNIDNWTIQEYSRGTTVSTALPNSSHPYLSPSKQIPNEYLTTTEPIGTKTDSIENTREEISNVLAGFSFNDLERESSASEQIGVSRVQIPSRASQAPPPPPPPPPPHHHHDVPASEAVESTTATGPSAATTAEGNFWQRLPLSISPSNRERVYVVTPQTVPTTLSTNRKKSEDDRVELATTENPRDETNFKQFESIERAYQVLPQAVNNLAVASTGPATIPLWGIMEHEDYAAAPVNEATSPILYAGHSKVSRAKQ